MAGESPCELLQVGDPKATSRLVLLKSCCCWFNTKSGASRDVLGSLPEFQIGLLSETSQNTACFDLWSLPSHFAGTSPSHRLWMWKFPLLYEGQFSLSSPNLTAVPCLWSTKQRSNPWQTTCRTWSRRGGSWRSPRTPSTRSWPSCVLKVQLWVSFLS